MVPLFDTVMVFGPSLFMNTPVSKEPSSAVTLCGTPPSRMATVTFAPCFTASGSGLNLKFWMVMLSVAPVGAVLVAPEAVVAEAAAAVVLVLDADLLPDEPQPAAPKASTARTTISAGRVTLGTATSGHPAGRTASNTSCCGDRRTAGG
jgi:hypothetical protein